ncbi:Glyco hydro 18 domain containing protein [Asbolus verrucosus]|uniref:Glyco hydro 18 domain containing protein n=1 Tax=Asbolus verrucosus TaxID=1661398 RepID=A0A482VQS3_ASBVE|nr:Glyco hydro 18 domain containing protein [Asbolus verrucosus]
MKFLICALLALAAYVAADNKIVCYYNSKAYFRDGQGKFDINFIDPALQFCTHLIYGYAAVNEESYNLVPLHENFDVTRNNYRHVTELKRKFPGLRVLLSVGGNEDVSGEGSEKNIKYRTLLESVKNRLAFVNSAHSIVKNYGFDVYYDPRALAPNLDFITLQAFDFYTPERNPKEADYPAPLYELIDRKFDENVDYQVRYWLQHGAPNNKLILGIPTYGRAWKMDEDSSISGVPPLSIDGAAEPGPHSKEAGLLSYPEVCVKLANPQKLQTSSGTHLRKMGDPSKRKGTFAFRLPDENEEGGIWVGYEDPDTVGNKASYVKAKGLGGVALIDITLDDFRGLCAVDKYPLYHFNFIQLKMGSHQPLLLLALIALAAYCKAESKVVCYYDSRSHFRDDIEAALQYCTHLIYGYAAINEETYKLTPMNEQFDTIKDNYRKVTDLKKRFPRVKFLLSVGGNADVSGEDSEKNIKYRTLLESTTHRLAFVNSAYTLIKAYGFDGLDLAWEFPENKPKKIRSSLGSAWHSFKKKIGGTKVIDENAADHRDQFVSLVRELRGAFKAENILLTLTVLPNVNSTVYYDPRALSPNLEFVNLLAFDFYTPDRNPKEADYPAPLYELVDRKKDENVDAQVRYWLNNGAPAKKIILGIPTYGRAWAMTDESDINGIPPLKIDGAAEPGPYSKSAGLLSHPEICSLVNNPQNAKVEKAFQIKKISDPSKRKGTYAFRIVDENNNGGIWIGYEDSDTIGYKAGYAKAKGLGGIAVDDLSLDDFKGSCGRDKYDILRTVKAHL